MKLDANNDGFLSYDELKAGFKHLHMFEIFQSVKNQGDPFQVLMNALDSNEDGKITYEEFAIGSINK